MVRGLHAITGRRLAHTLAGIDGVEAVYLSGSSVRSDFDPASSDLDLYVAIADRDPAEEVAVLASVAQPLRRAGALVPADIGVVSAERFDADTARHAAIGPKLASDAVTDDPDDWRLLAGRELRSGGPRPRVDLRLHTVRDDFAARALAACAEPEPWLTISSTLSFLDKSARRERLAWPAAAQLAAARERLYSGTGGAADAAAAITAVLAIIDEHRAAHPFPMAEHPGPDAGWPAQRPDARAVTAATRLLATLPPSGAEALASATLHHPPYEEHAVLLLEAGEPDALRPLVDWVAGGAARAAAPDALRIHVLTRRVAQDAWRSRLDWISLLAAPVHIAGEPLSPRIGLPELAAQQAFGRLRAQLVLARMRAPALGWAGALPDPAAPLRLAAEARLALGEPPLGTPAALAAATPDLAGLGADPLAALGVLPLAEWTRRGLAVWRVAAATTALP